MNAMINPSRLKPMEPDRFDRSNGIPEGSRRWGGTAAGLGLREERMSMGLAGSRGDAEGQQGRRDRSRDGL